MKITVLTLFPEILKVVLSSSIIGRAQKNKLLDLTLVNIRDFSTDKHKSVDDKPYGGGVGMIMRIDVVERAISNSTLNRNKYDSGLPRTDLRSGTGAKLKERVVLLDPKGKLFNQTSARRYSKLDHLILVCGHYEGIDSRILHFVDESISIGPYILTGGEIPAMTLVDSVTRLLPGVLSKKEATINESYTKNNIFEYPQYTRPNEYKGLSVPKILLSGNHQQIEKWKEKAITKRIK